MGNHTIAERMFRIDPRVMNYAPLSIALTCGADGTTRFTFDLPRSQFASFNDPAIAAVGHLLDQKVAALLRHLTIDVPAVLTTASPRRHHGVTYPFPRRRASSGSRCHARHFLLRVRKWMRDTTNARHPVHT